ncbi:hypothetical protein RND71_018971 [Anisodus tanguticus]|uniref:ATP-dependent zinc metalloprotease FTSH, chloroplastic n=1 Tax=Anisodus tanguticus TaxID=243964 RepID=A0AAE1VKQ5_9SOLA|nr:hypothetical protein RND71_018971 [Anisodus tanguticus]
MATIGQHLLRPVIHVQISLNFQYNNPNYLYRQHTFSNRYGFLHEKKPISKIINTSPFRPNSIFPKSLNGFEFLGKNNSRKNIIVRVNGSCEQDSDSTEKPETSATDSKKIPGLEPGRVNDGRVGFINNSREKIMVRANGSCEQDSDSSGKPESSAADSKKIPDRIGLEFWGGNNSRKKIIVRANGSGCEQDSDSTETPESSATDSKKNPGQEPGRVPSSGPSKQGKDNWWWWSKGKKLRWEPIVQAQEIGVLLLQLGIVMFVMRLLRPGLPLPGSDPRAPTMFVSVPYSEFLSKINSNKVDKVEVDGVHIMFKLKSNEVSSSSVVVENNEAVNGNSKLQDSEALLLRSVSPTKKIVYTTTRPSDIKTPYEKMLENDVEFGSPDKRSGGFLNSALIALFYVAVLAGLLHRFPVNFSQSTAGQLRNRKSGGSGGAKVSELGETITFADVAGVDEAKEELEEIVEFLRNPDKYVRLGARPPRGVLLVGLPGTGKTLLAKAVAGEAEVPFISCSASEFVELYVGMGASRVRDLFARAKKEAPSIIFIDEIDAVAKSRDGKFRIVSNDEREQTLNQLLTEMDGFDSNSAVIVLGATNRSDVLDPALCRPGRFDRVVMVEAPDRNGREAILKVHVSKKELPLAQDVNLGNIASMTTGFTGADLANLVNEAALLAGRLNKIVVEKVDFIQAVERSIAGIEKKTAKLQGSEKAVVARHEAGHAVVGTAVAYLLSGQPRVEKLSILPRSGGALGFTYIPPTNEDRYLLFVDELRGRLVTLLGGRAAEEVLYSGRVSTGAFDDIRKATDMAYKAVAEYGLSPTIGPISVATLSGGGIDDGGSMPWGKDQGHLVDLVQREVKALLQSALDIALCVVRANLKVLEGLGSQLEEQEKVEGEDLQEWLSMVIAPAELNFFVKGKQASLLPLQAGSG